MAFVLRPPSERIATLSARLAHVGQSRRRSTILSSCFSTFAFAVIAIVTSCFLDRAFHLPPLARAVLLTFTIVTTIALIVRKVIPSYRLSASSHATAMLIETANPQLNDALASAVEFSHHDTQAESDRFRTVVITRAENLMRHIEPERLVPSGSAWAAFWCSVMAVAALALFVFVSPALATRSFVRFLDPFGSHPWPPKTVIEVNQPGPFPLRMAKGDPLTIRFTVSGVIPELAQLSLRLADTPGVDEPVPLRSDSSIADFFSSNLTIDASRIPKNFEFRLTANDGDTGWLAVEVLPPPRLVPRDERSSPQVTIIPPAYSKLSAAQLPDGTGIIESVSGTKIRMAAAADRSILHAEIVPLSDPATVHIASSVAALASLMQPLLAPAREEMAESYARPFPVTISGPDRTWLDIEFIPHGTGLHALKLTDDSGLTGTRLFDLRMYPDPAPTLSLDRPDPNQDALVLLPTAKITMSTKADDRTFGLKSVWLEYRIKDGELRTIPLADYAALGQTLPAIAGGTAFTPQCSSSSASIFGIMPISRFVKADRSAPVDGDTITLRTAGDDWDDVSVLKAPGRSREVVIKVVSKSTLDAVLQKGLAEVRPQLRLAAEREKESIRLTKEFEKAMQSKENATPAEREKLAQAEQAQRDVKAKLSDARDGLRKKVDDLQRIAKANGLPTVDTAAQVDAAQRTLTRLTDENLELAESALHAARMNAERTNSSPAEKENAKAALNAAQKNQQAVANGLNQLMERLAQWGGAGEIRADATSIKDKVASVGDDIKAQNDPSLNSAQTQANQKKISDDLNKLADETNNLLAKAAKIAEEKSAQAGAQAGSDPAASEKLAAEANALRDSIAKAGGQQLPADLHSAAQAAKAGRMGQAESARASASERLSKMTESLVEKRNEPSAEELKKNRNQDEKDLNKLKEEFDELRKKTKQAEAIPDPKEKKAELQRLAAEQEKIQKEAEKLAEKLTRDRTEKTAESVRRAAEQMAAAAQEQKNGQAATQEQQDAADKLQQAQNEFKQETKSADEQLAREEREKLIERIKSLRDRQAAAITEAKRLLAEANKVKRWDRPLLISLSDLGDVEQAIANELRPFAEKELASLIVFGKLAATAADALERAKVRIGERKDELLIADPGAAYDVETEALAHGRVLAPMQLALKRLDLLLDAVKTDPKKPDGGNAAAPMPPGGGNPGGENGEGGGGAPQGQAIPPLAQIKALRGMQADVNERTTAFYKQNPDPAKYDDNTRDELKELERDQREISELFEKMLSLLQKSMPEAP
ncbi:MAG: hypothetical protein U0798_07920 [Gemmataceae bacterium]